MHARVHEVETDAQISAQRVIVALKTGFDFAKSLSFIIMSKFPSTQKTYLKTDQFRCISILSFRSKV